MEVFVSKKCLSLSLVLLLLTPAIAKAKSMLEENFEREQKSLKSEWIAMSGSFIATAGPSFVGYKLADKGYGVPLLVGGLIVGPSAGHFYAGQTGRGIKGIVMRGGILVLAAVVGCELDRNASPDSEGLAVGFSLLIGGLLGYAHGIYDICTTPSSVRKYNKSLLEENSLRLVPEVNPVDKRYGLSIVYGF